MSTPNEQFSQFAAFNNTNSPSPITQALSGTPSPHRTPSPAQFQPHNTDEYEVASFLSNLNPQVIMKVSTSEPRDALQSERTCLTFIRFATTLFFTALGVALNFKFKTSSKNGDEEDEGQEKSTYSTVISFILIFLSLAVLVVSGVSYFITINRYAAHKIQNYGFNNFHSVICFTSVVLTLMGISISLIVEGYLEEES
ncbi:hypothetical protein CLIB1423_13S00738 [[Candida] railenensis]|uniref:DUF202 domain-containing protein n=1 Tax=[Candida] railenensis TaxID=45579 RepID=A0A9P0VZE7_9ASCO|nr:hypothetical protein CLIB1423_13S00738 [[Candida] railenensis]